jgi:hypothetical protein
VSYEICLSYYYNTTLIRTIRLNTANLIVLIWGICVDKKLKIANLLNYIKEITHSY